MLLISIDLHTFVVDQECLIAHTTLAIMPGQKVANKRLTSSASFPAQPPCPSPSWRPAWQEPLPLHQAPMRRRRRHRRRLRLRSGGGAGFLPGGVAFEDFLPCPRWGRRCRTFRIGEERDVLDEEVPEERVPRGIRKVFQDMTQLGT